MSEKKSGTRGNVGILDIAPKLPGLLMDLPVITRGVVTGFLARPTAKTSIGKVFQERAARYGDKLFIKFGDEQLTYREANETVNRYAAVLASRGVGHGDVVGVMLRNSPHSVLLMLAVVKCGAVAGMLNYHQRGKVLAHSIGLLGAKALVAETDFVEPLTECDADTDGLMTLDELQQSAATAPATNPATTSAVLAGDKAFYIFTSGTTGMPKASVMTHYRWLRALAGFGGLGMRLTSDDTLYCCLPLYHNNALTVALSSVLNSGSTLALGKSFSASKFWDEVIAMDATAFVYIGEICAYLLNQPKKATDRKHRVRVIAGNGLRPTIWDDFTKRFGISRVCEFYAASEGQHRVPQRLQRRQDHRHLPVADRVRRIRRRVRRPEAWRRRPRPQGQDRRARVAAVEGQQLPAVRRLHRQGRDREEAGAQRVQGRRRLVQHR